jgi:predicted Zn finger-like uncharacterized protein
MRPIVKISCPACSAKYSIADDKVQERLAKIRCRKCGATIVIDGKSSPPHVYTAAGDAGDAHAAPAEAGQEYSVDFGEGDQRTMSVRDIVRAYGAGQITGETYVWAEGFADWQQLSEVPDLMSAVAGGGSRAPAAPAPSPWDARPTAQRSSQLPRTTSVSARASTGRPSQDLFGGVSRAGNEDEVATSAPEQPSQASATGTRNESSVLFSLSALTSAAQNQRPSARPPAVGGASRDDSGLIDLKALTAAAVKSDTGAMAMPAVPAVAPLASPLGVASPLGLAPPLGGGVATSADFPQQKSKTPIIIAALLSVGLLAVAAAIVLRPPPPPPPAPVVAAPPAPPAPTPTPEPIAAAPPATGTAEATPAPEASAKPTAQNASRARPVARRPSGSSQSSSSKKEEKASSSSPAAAPPKKSSNCGCGPADLQCAMRCAARK